jgi:hypothetical protein
MFEYANDGAAQAAYVTSDVGSVPTSAYDTGSNNLVSHFDGADEAVAYSDPVKGAYTFAGTAQLDTAQYKFSTASLLLDGNSDYLTTGDSTDWAFGTGDFTMDCWVRFNSVSGAQVILSQYVDNNNYWFWKWDSSEGFHVKFVNTDGTGIDILASTATWTPSTNTWYHLAVVRNGSGANTIKLYVDGESKTLATDTWNKTSIADLADSLFVGRYGTGAAAGYFNGWIDELRVLKGTAVWTSDFYAGAHLQSYSESTIKSQGSYSLKGLASLTNSLNETLNRTVDPTIDLSGQNEIKLDIYAERTGTNLQLQIHDSGGTTSSYNIAVNSADTWETKTWDISAIADVDKDAIDQIIIKVTNADAANTFYVDNVYSPAITAEGNAIMFGCNF